MFTRSQDTLLVSSSNAYVLYVDHQGHPAPLTECFHATASRRLSSTAYRYPMATAQEVDSAYCPQCLTFHDAATGAELGYCPKATCRRCPLCLSVASVQTAPAESGGIECFYQCGLCDWTSKDCQLSFTVPLDDDNKLGRSELIRAAEELSAALTERRKRARQPVEGLHKYITEQWSNHSNQRRNEKKRHEEEWSVELLEAKLQDKAANLHSDQSDYPLPSLPGLEVKRISIQDILAQKADEESAANSRKNDMSLLSHHFQSLDAEPLLPLPLPIPLALRRSRRCRAELAEGRPGILLKPKLNPLEGDSSLPTGHGQWHRKDSSAMHVIPRVRVVRHRHSIVENEDKTTSNKHAFLLKVANPTLGTVRLRITESAYGGEVDFWSDDGLGASTTTSFTGLLVDTLTHTVVSAEVKPILASTLGTTETVELLSAEDSIIELGGKARETPEQVRNWNADAVVENLDSDTGTVASASMRLVVQSASDAWFELVVREGGGPSSPASAIPLALQVDLGNGSWESSLIPVKEGVDNDKVSFDLVLVWT